MTLSPGQIITVQTPSGPRKGRVVKSTSRGVSVKLWTKGKSGPPRLSKSARTFANGDVIEVAPPRRSRKNPPPGAEPVEVRTHSRRNPRRQTTQPKAATKTEPKKKAPAKRRRSTSAAVQQGLPFHATRTNPSKPRAQLWPANIKAGEYVVMYATRKGKGLTRHRDKLFARLGDAQDFLKAQPSGRALILQVRDTYE